MNFNKLSKEKKNQLVLVGLITVAVLVGLGYGLIRFQLAYVQALQRQKVEADKNLKKMLAAIQSADAVQNQVGAATKELAAQEEAMVTGDKFSWLVTNIKTALKQHPKLEVPDFSTILEDDCSLVAKFPYTQVTISIKGSGYYHDIGRFLSDLENDRPHFRVLNLELEPAQPGPQGDKERTEKLSFKLSIAALVKPT